MRSFSLILFLIALACTLGCSPSSSAPTQREQYLMGTSVSISISGVHRDEANRAADLAFREIRRIQEMMSTFLPESEVSQINRSAGGSWTSVHPELLTVVREALRYGRLSDGAFDITYKPLSGLWSFEPDSRPPDPEEVRRILPLINYQAVRIDDQGRILLEHPGMAMGLGGIAKGYAVDCAVAVLQEQGITNAIVNAGGDLRVLGRPSTDRTWRIGIQDPRNRGEIIRAVAITQGALATSGDYENYFLYQNRRYHHILDPRTGFPARGCRSVTVIAPTTMMADAMATAVFLMGPEKGMALIQELPDIEGMIIDETGKIITSAGFIQEGTT